MISFRKKVAHISLAMTAMLLAAVSLRAQWSDLTQIDGERSVPQLAYLDGRLYLFGGFSPLIGQTLGSAKALDIATGEWKPIADMPEPKSNGYAAAVNGKIYLVGGTKGSELATNVMEYDPATDSYTMKAQMPVPTLSFAGATIGGTIYMIGGIPANGNRASPTAGVYAYDIATDSWKGLTDFPYLTSNFAATAIGNSIYTVGGSIVAPPLVNHPYTYRGDVAGNGTITWTRLSDAPDALTFTACGTVRGKMLLAGGVNQDGNATHSVYSYDPATNAWSRSYPMPFDGAFSCPMMPGDGESIYYAGSVTQRRVLRFTGGQPLPIVFTEQHDFFATTLRGTTTRLPIRLYNKGVLPLGGVIEAPAEISWLAPSSLQIDSVPPLSAALTTFEAGDPALPVGDYTTTVTLKSNDPARPEIPLRVHLFVRDSLPLQPTQLVIEEGTGNWCGWEPYGRSALDSVRVRHPANTIILAYHGPSDANEPMFTRGMPETVTGLGLQVYPSAAVQRIPMTGEERPMMTDQSAWIIHAEELLRQQPNAPVRIDVDSYSYNDVSRFVVAEVRVTTTNGFVADTSVAYRISTIVTEDSLNYPQSKFILQQDGTVATITLDPYYHNDVVRMVWPDYTGRELAPPDEAVVEGRISPGARIDQEMAFSARGVSNVKNASLIFLVHVMRHGQLAEILQAYRQPLRPIPSGVDDDATPAESTAGLTIAPNPASGRIALAYPLRHPGDARIEIFSVTGERLFTIDQTALDAGVHTAEIDLSSLSAGVYLVRLSADGSIRSRLVTVMR